MTRGAALRFGVAITGSPRPEQDPTLQLEQGIALAEHADRLGLHECWWAPRRDRSTDTLLTAARAAATTHRIRLGATVAGTGADPRQPLERAIQLDHLTRGRFALAIEDAADATTDDALATIQQLLDDDPEAGEPLALLPYQGAIDVRVAATRPSPLAGRHGVGLLTAAAAPDDASDRAAASPSPVRRRNRRTVPPERWSAMGLVHVAETEIEARRQVRYGLRRSLADLADVLPAGVRADADPDVVIDAWHAQGTAVVGTPAMVIEHLERVHEEGGGFGTFLVEELGWARPRDAAASLGLLALEVVPHFSGSTRRPPASPEAPRSISPATPTQPAAPSPVLPSTVAPSTLERFAAPASAHLPTPSRGITRPPHPRIVTEDLGPLLDGVPHRRGRHAEGDIANGPA